MIDALREMLPRQVYIGLGFISISIILLIFWKWYNLKWLYDEDDDSWEAQDARRSMKRLRTTVTTVLPIALALAICVISGVLCHRIKTPVCGPEIEDAEIVQIVYRSEASEEEMRRVSFDIDSQTITVCFVPASDDGISSLYYSGSNSNDYHISLNSACDISHYTAVHSKDLLITENYPALTKRNGAICSFRVVTSTGEEYITSLSRQYPVGWDDYINLLMNAAERKD